MPPVLSLPLELFLEVFSYFTDHRRFIRENYYGRDMYVTIKKRNAGRSIAIRRLTMTCWPLRNRLLPLLWADTEGCISHTRYDHTSETGGAESHLYAQCVYLSLNPAIATYVRAFSVNLSFFRDSEGLTTNFVDCLVRLPNLNTLEILDVGSRAPVSKALKRKYAVFPSIHELRIPPACHHFVRNCPNLESLIFTSSMDSHAPSTIASHGRGLKRIAGVTFYHWCGLRAAGSGCPDLREIGIVGTSQSNGERFQSLRELKHLTVVDINLEHYIQAPADWQTKREIWKKELIGILKDCPSTDRKVLRWTVVKRRPHSPDDDENHDVLENEEVEVT